jgi:uncharacterized protein (DUF433 family)
MATATLDWSQCPAVESVPGKVGGAWVFRDTRLPVATVMENLEDLSVEEVMEQFDVTREQIAAVLEFVAQSLRAPEQSTAPVNAHSFDHGAPRGIARALAGHTVVAARERGWDRLNNGALLKAAEEASVELLVTTDQRIHYQQNLMGRKIAIVVLTGTTKWSRVRLHLARIAAVVAAAAPGSYTEVAIPYD